MHLHFVHLWPSRSSIWEFQSRLHAGRRWGVGAQRTLNVVGLTAPFTDRIIFRLRQQKRKEVTIMLSIDTWQHDVRFSMVKTQQPLARNRRQYLSSLELIDAKASSSKHRRTSRRKHPHPCPVPDIYTKFFENTLQKPAGRRALPVFHNVTERATSFCVLAIAVSGQSVSIFRFPGHTTRARSHDPPWAVAALGTKFLCECCVQ